MSAPKTTEPPAHTVKRDKAVRDLMSLPTPPYQTLPELLAIAYDIGHRDGGAAVASDGANKP